MRYVIYGGTFDPFHSAHKEIVEYLSDKFDKVILVPTNITYYKPNQTMYSFEDRCKMVEDKVSYLPNIIVSKIEANIPENWRFIDTIKFFIESFCQADIDNIELAKKQANAAGIKFYVAIGSDSLQKIKTWYKWEEILALTKLIVFNRPGYDTDLPTDIPYEYIPMNNPESSTRIRKEILSKNLDL